MTMKLIQTLRARAARRAQYNRTRHALASLPLDTALDLDIYRGDADRIARQAVYGA